MSDKECLKMIWTTSVHIVRQLAIISIWSKCEDLRAGQSNNESNNKSNNNKKYNNNKSIIKISTSIRILEGIDIIIRSKVWLDVFFMRKCKKYRNSVCYICKKNE